VKMKLEEKEWLLRIAREALKSYPEPVSEEVLRQAPPSLKEEKGVFVTLYSDGVLRGCIGSLEPSPLARSVALNAALAGYHDPRFPPLTREEAEKVVVEVSVLSPLKKTSLRGDSLLKLLEEEKQGVFLKARLRSATFLPQVWEHFSTAREFLKNLCLKAGLPRDAWEGSDAEIYIYSAEKVREEKR